MKLFFGCSNEDKDIVDLLMTYLNKVFEIDLEQMYNCYVGKNKFPVGKDFHLYIKNAIIDCDRVIILITPESLKRKYCLCELGAAWGLDKNIIIILVAPCSFYDLFESPLAGTHMWSVDLRNESSLKNLIKCIDEDKDFKLIKRKITCTENLIAETEFKNNMLLLGQKNADLPPLPDYSKCYPFHSDGNASTLRIVTNDKEKVKVRIDLSTFQPNYVGFFFDLKDADWTGLIANNYQLTFNVDSLSTIKAVKIEFKNKFLGRDLCKIGEYTIQLTGRLQEETLCLRDICDDINEWQHMKEITFVFQNYDIEEMGTFTISNFGFLK